MIEMTLDKINSISNESGIYNLYDENKELLYIGMSMTLRNRLIRHHSQHYNNLYKWIVFDTRDKKIIKDIQIRYFEYIILNKWIQHDILSLEKKMIKLFRPPFNYGYGHHINRKIKYCIMFDAIHRLQEKKIYHNACAWQIPFYLRYK